MANIPRHAAVIAGGDMTTSLTPPADSHVIAADSGYDHAMAAGTRVDVLVGDLDSISEAGLAHAEAAGVRIERHDEAKDASDLELAFDVALLTKAPTIVLYGGEGGSLAHLLGVASLITSDRYENVAVRWHTGTGVAHVVRNHQPLTATAAVGTAVSVLAVTGAKGVSTHGLAWRLDGDELARGTSRGLSNLTNQPEFSVTVGSGVLLVIVEGPPTT